MKPRDERVKLTSPTGVNICTPELTGGHTFGGKIPRII